jgi:hypothetical protein
MMRRHFLKGMLMGVPAGTALIQLATPEDTQLLNLREPILLGQPEYLREPIWDFDPIVYMKDANGTFISVGHVTQLTVHQHVIDAYDWTGEVRAYPGLRDVAMSFQGGRWK